MKVIYKTDRVHAGGLLGSSTKYRVNISVSYSPEELRTIQTYDPYRPRVLENFDGPEVLPNA